MFHGTFQHTLDAKGRLTIPVQFRDEFADGLILTIGLKDCLLAYPVAAFEALNAKLRTLPSADDSVESYRLLLVGLARRCNLDGMGRILIPADLREMIKLGQEADVIGQDEVLEIWPAKTIDSIIAETRRNSKQIRRRLAELGF
ncbi:MAG: division/cell wall cluster transcriptional repressor MraZ [Chloroflexi bacterium]|nr:division/cell wall cluster transcriptional repressor MraZ [Chloroflexota bacterium]